MLRVGNTRRGPFSGALVVPAAGGSGFTYPLDIDEASLQAFGFTGRLTLSNGDKTGDYAVQGFLGAIAKYAAAPQVGVTLDASTGDRSFRWNIGALASSSGGVMAARLYLYNSAISAVLYSFEYYSLTGGILQLGIVNSVGTTVYDSGGHGQPHYDNIDIRFKAGSSAIEVYIDGTKVTLSNAGAYTPQAVFPVIEAFEGTGVNPSTPGQHITESFLVAAADMAGATWLSGSTDFGGTAIT